MAVEVTLTNGCRTVGYPRQTGYRRRYQPEFDDTLGAVASPHPQINGGLTREVY